jgi:hypothetical protein
MFDQFGFTVVFYVTGRVLIEVFGGRKYLVSISEELSDPFYTEETKTLGSGQILVRADTVILLGIFFWFCAMIFALVGYWAGWFDVLSPIRNWLFESIE